MIATARTDFLSDRLNLVVAVVLGIAFGFVLEQAGFSSSRRLVGVFYGYDFTVIRVFFTATVTAMSGMLLLGHFGLLDLDMVVVNPTWLAPAIVGRRHHGDRLHPRRVLSGDKRVRRGHREGGRHVLRRRRAARRAGVRGGLPAVRNTSTSPRRSARSRCSIRSE